MFHLIEFLTNKTVAVVPQNWCSDGVTYWPNYRSDERVDREVKNAEEPGPDWKTYDARIVKSCDQYFEAQQLLKKSLTCNTSDLQSEEEEEIRVKRKPKLIHFFGDSDDDSEEEGRLKKRARGPAKPSPQPPAPIPPPPCRVPSCTVAPPPPIPPTHCLQMEHRRPAEEQSPSANQVYRPTWREGRSDTIVCSAAEVHIISLLENLKQQQDQLITKMNYLTSKLNPTG
ncbi:hypothetical protein MATL_G00039210 [Megalops atlanticus]|uniref:Uncharacterized protein n=1 Tax=Megalops atlanticus TaxID=7932 RepID=A0A9D3QCV2_MEGAT|nr:hypothetical protein MATL_G00039210 [Megalops atlanticus]